MRFEETTIPNNFTADLKFQMIGWEPEHTHKVYEVLTASMSTFLSNVKKKDVPTAIVLKDLKGNHKIGGKVVFHENENKEMPGNWTYELSLNEDDFKDEGIKIFEATEQTFEITVSQVAFKLHRLQFTSVSDMHTIFLQAIDTLVKYLDVNAKVGEEVTVEMAGYFVASVEVIDDHKIMSIVPDGAMKRIIKDDSSLV